MGTGLVDYENNSFILVDFAVIKPRPSDSLAKRLEFLYSGLMEKIKVFEPDVLSIEEAFYGANARTALVMGHVRGAAMVCGRQAGLPVFEYAARKVKSSITGNGAATKEQVQFMVQRLLGLKAPPTPFDASDALAIALCHALNAKFQALR